MKIIDLTIPFGIATPPWPTYEPLQLKYFKRLAPNGANGQLLTHSNHLGTHLDGEIHFYTPGKDIASLDFDFLAHEAAIVDLSDACGELLGASTNPGALPTVYVLTRQPELGVLRSLLGADVLEGPLVTFSPLYGALVVYDDRAGKGRRYGLNPETVGDFVRGVFRQWLRRCVEDPPPWLAEGFAEYFGRCELKRGRLRCGLVPEDVTRLPVGPFLLQEIQPVKAPAPGHGGEKSVRMFFCLRFGHRGSAAEGIDMFRVDIARSGLEKIQNLRDFVYVELMAS